MGGGETNASSQKKRLLSVPVALSEYVEERRRKPSAYLYVHNETV
jgi:hypothetical protein